MIQLALNDHKFQQTIKRLENLPTATARKALGRAVSKAAAMVAREARKRAPRGANKILSSSKGIRAVLNKNKTGAYPTKNGAVLGVTYSIGWTGGKGGGHHGRLVEFGHKIKRPAQVFKEGNVWKGRKGSKSIDTGARTKKFPHLVPAFVDNQDAIFKIMKSEIEKFIFGEYAAGLKGRI